jgi:hypothetical protein
VSRIYDLFVSGGRDSVVAATVAYEEARQAGIPARVVFINELPAFKVPSDILPFNPLSTTLNGSPSGLGLSWLSSMSTLTSGRA